MDKILLNIVFSLGTILVSALISFWFSTRISKQSHQMQLRSDKAESYKIKFLEFKDYIQIAQQQVQYRYLNLERFGSKEISILENKEIFNRILRLGTELNSITVLHGKLFNIEILTPDDIYLYHSAIVDLAFELERLKPLDEDIEVVMEKLEPYYDDMMRITADAIDSMLDYVRKIEEKYHKDIK